MNVLEKETNRFELFTVVLIVWLMFQVIGLTFTLTRGTAKLFSSILIGLAVLALFACLILVGGIVLLVPITLTTIAFGIIKTCL